MGFLGSVGRAFEKTVKGLVKYTSPLGSALVSAHDQRKANRRAEGEYNAQQAVIAETARKADVERQRIASERAKSEAKLTMGQQRANRRRVRGGLFGDANVDTNVSPRLG